MSNEFSIDDPHNKDLVIASSMITQNAQDLGNDPRVEAAWAMKACEHAEVYFNLLCSVDPKELRLSRHDDAIYKAFREAFPDLRVDVLDEDEFKTEDNKKKWRLLCEKFNGVIEDYNFGTLLRLRHDAEYSESNTMLVLKVQFYAIEVARNREGCNGELRSLCKTKVIDQDAKIFSEMGICKEVLYNFEIDRIMTMYRTAINLVMNQCALKQKQDSYKEVEENQRPVRAL